MSSTFRRSLKKCNSTTIFEDNQANLEQAVEDLSEMLERPITPATIPEIREQVTNKTAFVQKRSDIILQDTLMGHWEVSSRPGMEFTCWDILLMVCSHHRDVGSSCNRLSSLIHDLFHSP